MANDIEGAVSEPFLVTKDGKRISRRVVLGGAAAGLGALLVGCGSDDDEATTDNATDDTAAATGGQDAPENAEPAAGVSGFTTATLTAAIGSGPGSLDPQAIAGTGGGNWPNYITHFNNLLLTSDQTVKPELVFVPQLASELPTVSADNLAWTIKIREGITWHNGDPFTAEDVKFSFDRNIGQAEYNPDFQSGYSGQYEETVDNVEVIDPLTVQVNLKQPDVIFLSRLSRESFLMVPKDYIEELGDEGFANSPVGLAHFKYVSDVPDAELVSERFDDFFPGFDSEVAAATGIHPAHVKNLVQKVIPDDQARIAALQAGEIDVVSNIASDIGAQMAAGDEFNVSYLPGDQPIMIEMNTALETDPTTGEFNPFRDKRVRLAVNHAVDIDAIIANVVTGFEGYAYGSSPIGFGFPPDLPDKRFQFDPDLARELLTEAGYPDGFDTTMIGPIGRWPNSRAVMEAVAGFLGEVGIRATVGEAQYQEVVEKVQAETLGPLIFWARAGGDDPGANFRWSYHSTGNFINGTPIDERSDGSQGGGDVTARIDELVEASEVAFDVEERKEIIEELITEFYLSAKSLYLYSPVTIVATNKDFSWDPHYATQTQPEYWNIQPVE